MGNGSIDMEKQNVCKVELGTNAAGEVGAISVARMSASVLGL